ncbi:MAG: hypothetical protein R3F53_30305 [Gammaproteobacteria bacterium]
MRENWKDEQEWIRKSFDREPLPNTRQEYMAQALKVRTGNKNAWIELLRYSTLDEQTMILAFPFQGIQESHMAGKKSYRGILSRIPFQHFEEYIEKAEPNITEYYSKNSISDIDYAAYLAFELLALHAPQMLRQLPQETWQKWAEYLVAYLGKGHTPEARMSLLKHLVNAKPQSAHTLERLITSKSEHGFYDIDDYEILWDDKFEAWLVGKIQQPELNPQTQTSLLHFLLKHRSQPAIALLREASESKTQLYIDRPSAFTMLLAEKPQVAWDIIQPLFDSDSTKAQELMLTAAEQLKHHWERITELNEDQLATLYIWLEQQFPERDDPKHDRVYRPTSRHAIATLRRHTLEHLCNRGTEAAITGIKHIVASFPDREWLKWKLQQAHTNTRRATWQGISPNVIFTLAKDHHAKMVRSEQELLDAVMDSLQRLQGNLQGATPLAPYLWNEGKKREHKNENRLSDFIKHHLSQDLNRKGVIINREIEINNWPGKGRGESVDLLVQAIAPESTLLTVVIEVKGCWHKDLLTSMKTQLKQRYLQGTEYRYGLYLVGWYGQEYCMKKTLDLDSLEKELLHQAVTNTDDQIVVKSMILNITYPNS